MQLDIYYYIDFDKNQYLNFLENYLKIYLNVNGYTVNNFINYTNKSTNNNINTNNKGNTNNKSKDSVNNGLLIFDEMFQSLKLKNSNETWFLYICNDHNNFLILLKRIPYEKKCYYVINKEPLYLNNEMKLKSLKKFGEILAKLVTLKTFFTYD
jgi:hypothetical protein